MRNNVEHYVVKPNTPAYDWPYEYSTPSNNSSCNCANNSEKLSVSIDNLQTTIAQLQKSVLDVSTIDIHNEDFVNILNQALNQYITVEQNANAIKELVDAEIQAKAGDISSTAVTNLQSDVAAIQAQLETLQPIVNNITELTEISQIDVTELQQYGDNITQVTADLTSLQSQLTQLSNTVSSLSTNMNSTVSDAVLTVLLETTALDNKVEQLVLNSNKITAIEGNISTIDNNLTNHINDTTVHVTAADRDKWNAAAAAASANSANYRFKVEDKTLSLEKYTA